MEVNPLLLKIAGQSKRQESMAVEKREVMVMNQSWMMLRCKMSKSWMMLRCKMSKSWMML